MTAKELMQKRAALIAAAKAIAALPELNDEQRAEFDADYERHLSFFKDLKILLATVNVVLRATGK